jgi:hypothetical protein
VVVCPTPVRAAALAAAATVNRARSIRYRSFTLAAQLEA